MFSLNVFFVSRRSPVHGRPHGRPVPPMCTNAEDASGKCVYISIRTSFLWFSNFGGLTVSPRSHDPYTAWCSCRFPARAAGSFCTILYTFSLSSCNRIAPVITCGWLLLFFFVRCDPIVPSYRFNCGLQRVSFSRSTLTSCR